MNNAVVDTGAPAAPGDTVVIYCTGLGAVTPAVSAGDALRPPRRSRGR